MASSHTTQQLVAQKEAARKLEEYIEKIHYSDRYSDDHYEYRHVILPKQLLKIIPKQYFCQDDSGTLRLLEEHEWRGIGITQSLGWEHYAVHAPEPHVLLFRRVKDIELPNPARGKPVTEAGRRK